MNHSQTLERRLGSKVRETIPLGYQCTAFAKQYVKERGRKAVGYFGGVGAYQGWINNNNTFDQNFYDKIPNTIQAIPQQGDIIIFKPNKSNNNHGHIGIVDSATKTYVWVLEQNGGLGKGEGVGTDAIRIRKYPYTNVVGWYHYKQSNMPPISSNEKATSAIDEDIQLLITDKLFSGDMSNLTPERVLMVLGRVYKKLKND